jgi:hypothetical protein
MLGVRAGELNRHDGLRAPNMDSANDKIVDNVADVVTTTGNEASGQPSDDKKTRASFHVFYYTWYGQCIFPFCSYLIGMH